MDHARRFRGESPEIKTEARLRAVDDTGYNRLLLRHQADYRQLYGRQELTLNTDDTDTIPTPRRLAAYRTAGHDPATDNLIYNFGRYLTITSSRPGSLPGGLRRALERAYHRAMGQRLPQQHQFPDALLVCRGGQSSRNVIGLCSTTSEPCANQTALPPANIWKRSDAKPRMHPTDGSSTHPIIRSEATDGGSTCPDRHGTRYAKEHFAFTSDTTYLREEAYPVMKELCHYWERTLKQLGRGGQGFESEYRPVDTSAYPELHDIAEGHSWCLTDGRPEIGPRGEDGVAHDRRLCRNCLPTPSRRPEYSAPTVSGLPD